MTVRNHLLPILCYALGGPEPCLPDTSEEWQTLLDSAVRHRVEGIVCQTLYKLPAFETLSPAWKTPLVSRSRAISVTQTRKTVDFLSLICFLAERNLFPLVVKGIVCRSLWQDPELRPSGDEDLLIHPEELPAYREALAEYGMTALSSSESEATYHAPNTGLLIEIHTCLFPENHKVIGSMNRFFSDVFTTAETHTVEGIPLRVPDPTLHLLYLFLHALKHFLYSGVGIRQLCDITLFAERFGSVICWDTIRAAMDELNATVWYSSILAICRDRLALVPESAHLPLAHFDHAIDTEPLLNDILSGAVYGADGAARLHSGNITLSAAEGIDHRSSLLRTLFPPLSAMKKRYPYLQRFPILLPYSWLARAVSYHKEVTSEGDNVTESLAIGKRRADLLTRYGLTPNRKKGVSDL